MGIVDTAMRLALQAHHGVVNKHDGEPYILHVHRVASNFGDDTLDQQLRKAVAWLHDTVEDTELTLKLIAACYFPSHSPLAGQVHVPLITDAVDAMTKRKGESNEDYYWRVKQNAIATDVKIADIHDNFGRNYMIEDEATRLRMAAKYSLGIEILCRQT
jgi:hypothetical protein